ncbi:CppA N-terminal domain-containing protein [Streptococcus entericus]|uniref:CppA N-terminal domain-containing protein n=1 Tax=Streptococcus entericus TaxID=155680 RepID=UPI0003801F4E|nr:CppA N-terminal domain-containing protein [Streptococcus entericus]
MKKNENMALLAPYIRVNNRQRNLDFYEHILGLRVLHEENAFAFLGGHVAKETRLTLEESPSYRTRAVNGPKKLHTLVLKADTAEIAELLARKIPVERVYKGQTGYAFSALSPEGDRLLLHGEDDVTTLDPVPYPDLLADSGFNGLSDVIVDRLVLNVPDRSVSLPFYDRLPLSVELNEAQGADLQADNDQTWDISMVECSVDKTVDLASFAVICKDLGLETMLNKKETVLIVTDPSRLDWWFVK